MEVLEGRKIQTAEGSAAVEKDHLEILLEDIRGKFDLVLEGHEVLRRQIQTSREESKERDDHLLFLIQTLNTKIDGVDERLGRKIDEVASDLSAHRRDTESHRGAYRVKEG